MAVLSFCLKEGRCFDKLSTNGKEKEASDREARPAAAARGGVGIVDLERRSAERIDEVDRAAAHEVEADRIDHQLHPVGFGDDIVGVDALGQAEAIGEARTAATVRSEEHTSELQSLMRISYAVFCLKNKTK